MRRRKQRRLAGATQPPPAPSNRRSSDSAGLAVSVLAGMGWSWAVCVLAARQHTVLDYTATALFPPAWGFIGLSLAGLALAAVCGAGLAFGAAQSVRKQRDPVPRAARWMLASFLVPAVDLLRLGGAEIPVTVLEAFFISAVTGAAAGSMAANTVRNRPVEVVGRRTLWTAAVWIVAFAAFAWWTYQGLEAYADYLLGFADVGQYAQRVANTWSGRGFLVETPGIPAFWDHFNPGLAMLVPLWAVVPDVRLFVVLQALCLACPAPLVYRIARACDASPGAAAAWAVAFLAYPPVGQLNTNFSYGWHPVSVALPLVLAAILLLLRQRRVAALLLAVLAGTLQEDVWVSIACFAAVMAVWSRLRAGRRDIGFPQGDRVPESLPAGAWALVATGALVLFVGICATTPFARFQTGRFSALGSSLPEILLSPILRPSVFWGNVLQWRSLCFVLALAVPLGMGSLLRAWPYVLTVAVPLGVLLAWGFVPATSIAFQYATMILPILVLGAVAGSARWRSGVESATSTARPHGLWIGGATALGASLALSVALGVWPWSGSSLAVVREVTYYSRPEVTRAWGDRSQGTPSNAALDDITGRLRNRPARILATGRIATHLVGAERLEVVGFARRRWPALAAEAGDARRPIAIFEWILLDRLDRFCQSDEDLDFVIAKAEEAGFERVHDCDGVVVYAQDPAAWGALER